MTSRASTAGSDLAVLVMLGAYVGGYFWLGERRDYWDSFSPPPVGEGELIGVERHYERQWHASSFYPASVVESSLRGIPVEAHDLGGY